MSYPNILSLTKPYPTNLQWIWRAVLIKLLTILSISTMMQYFNIVDLFLYADFATYKNGDYVAPNFLYGLFVYAIDAESLADPRLILLSIFTALIVDLLALNLLSKYFKLSPKILIFYAIFSLHPYFSVYALRFDTLDFASLSCILFLTMLHVKLESRAIIIGMLILLILAMFRLSALIFLISALIGIYVIRTKIRISVTEKLNCFFIIILAIFIIRQNGFSYFVNVANASSIYGFSLDDTRTFFGEFGYISDIVVHHVAKLIALFGGREALYTEGLDYIFSSRLGVLQLLSFIFLAVLNLTGLIMFVRLAAYSGYMIPVLLSLIVLVGSFLTVGHMRYLLPYQPMILIGLLYLTELKFLWRKLH